MPVDNSRGPLLATFLALALGGSLALAQAEDNPWPRVRVPTPGPARAIGEYAAGCLQGAEELPRDGTGYLVTRLERRRYYGHPALISFVRSLGAAVHKHKLSALLVGDLAQPRGGRANDGHASHQTGLDVDIAYEPLPRGTKLPLSLVTREALKASTVLDAKGQRMLPAFRRRVTTILDLAASDPRVARIFVNPSIKRELCDAASRERAWLRKIRPWHGHADHFHVRLACPENDRACVPQAALPAGDGCGELGFWFDAKAQAARKAARADYQNSVDKGRGWPEACDGVWAAE
jgi:penicillin-insensitive murein endopeptidase